MAVLSEPSVKLPTTFLLNDIININEGSEIEYKKSFHNNQFSKYRETICAFLNTSGGYIVYGILNDCTIVGCKLNELDKDNISLFVDRLYTILYKSDGEKIDPNTLKVNFVEIAKNIYIVIISCYREPNISYQFITGESWIRLNASNFNINKSKLYTKEEVRIKINELNTKSISDIIDIENKYKNDIKQTVVMISEIIYNKNKIENNAYTIKYYNKYILISMMIYLLYIYYNFIYM